MGKYQSKAETSFQNKLKQLTAPEGYIHDLGGSHKVLGDDGEIKVTHHRVKNLNMDLLETLFCQYGHYLELIGGDVPVGRVNRYRWPTKPPVQEEIDL